MSCLFYFKDILNEWDLNKSDLLTFNNEQFLNSSKKYLHSISLKTNNNRTFSLAFS